MRTPAPLIVFALLLLPVAAFGQEDLDPPEPRPRPEAPGEEPDEPEPRPAEVPAGAAPHGVSHFPLEVGRRWTYRVVFRIEPVGAKGEPPAEPASGPGEHRMDVYVADPQTLDGRTAAVLEWKLDQDLAQRSYFVVEDGFVRCLKRLQGFAEHVKDFVLVPPQPVIPAAPKVGQQWIWEGKAGADPGKQTFEVLREEEVTTPAGTFQTLVLQTVFVGEDDSTGTMTRWLAPGVGIVKEVSEVRTPIQSFRTEGELVRYEAP